MPWSIPSPEGFSVFGREQGETGALSVSTVVNCIRVLSDDMGILPFRRMRVILMGRNGSLLNNHRSLRIRSVVTFPCRTGWA